MGIPLSHDLICLNRWSLVVFDLWAGELAPHDYRIFSLPFIRSKVQLSGGPTGCSHDTVSQRSNVEYSRVHQGSEI